MRFRTCRDCAHERSIHQYDGLATASSVRAEYRRRGWKIPKPTRGEQA